ncbi:LOW QUALITY PROTEIN: Helitron helicase [Phytophthora megakarya]|uniref:Helitron helicase n=1 Tax=Phytophthora megakarya TaxID=4795 RepID=A0A225X397_9STRA|nr:LOW QUALITY PROTEIN: Helitron helicase [Phytophthora megakarya]
MVSLEFKQRGFTRQTFNRKDVNRFVSTELPDKENTPNFMIQWLRLRGPCENANPNFPCMKNGKCSKKLPKPLSEDTTMAE